MNYKVIWSKQAENDLLSILEYLLTNLGNGSATKFKEKVDNQVELIASFPKMYSITSFIEDA
jgi:plasmid stabilization system protein ParE